MLPQGSDVCTMTKCAVCRRQRGVCQVQPSMGCVEEQQWGLTEESLVPGLRVEREGAAPVLGWC